MRRGRWLVSFGLVAALVLAPSMALAIGGRVVENVGIRRLVPLKKTAALNLHDSTNILRLWKPTHVKVDDDYQGAGYTVYEYFFGKKSATTGKYPVEMYSKKSTRHVFAFIINSSAFVTKNGTHVGTTEAALTSRYGSKIKKHTTPTYTYYRMSIRTGVPLKTQSTEFWCKSGKIKFIMIARY